MYSEDFTSLHLQPGHVAERSISARIRLSSSIPDALAAESRFSEQLLRVGPARRGPQRNLRQFSTPHSGHRLGMPFVSFLSQLQQNVFLDPYGVIVLCDKELQGGETVIERPGTLRLETHLTSPTHPFLSLSLWFQLSGAGTKTRGPIHKPKPWLA